MVDKKQVIISLSLSILASLLIFTVIWFKIPATFLRDVEVNDISCVNIFDGTTGDSIDIKDIKDIEYILNNIQNTKMKKEKLSIGYMGYGFRLTFYDKDNNKLEEIIINSDDTLKKDPFFYKLVDGSLCYDYIKNKFIKD